MFVSNFKTIFSFQNDAHFTQNCQNIVSVKLSHKAVGQNIH